MSRIFINYRRLDSAPYAGRLYDRLARSLGGDLVFMDIDKIEPGDDFVEVIEQRLESCNAVIALIGKTWASCVDDSGRRRLDNPDDHVRRELAAALRRKVRVIPVLVGGATMPRSDQLPEDLAPLCRRNAIEVSDARFHQDVDRLVNVLQRTIGELKDDKTVTSSEPPERLLTPQPALGESVEIGAERVLRGHQKPVIAVAFSPDGQLLASAGGGGFFAADTAIRLWCVEDGKLLREIPGHKNQVTSVTFSPDGQTLASISVEAVRLWRVADGKRLHTIEEARGKNVAFSPDGSLLAAGLDLWRVSDAEHMRSLYGKQNGSLESQLQLGNQLMNTCVAFSPDGLTVGAGGLEGWCLWRVADGRLLLKREQKDAYVRAIAFSSDGRMLATGWYEQETNLIVFWSLPDGNRIRVLKDSEMGGAGFLAFHPNRGFLVTGNSFGSQVCWLWRIADGALVKKLQLPDLLLSSNRIHHATFSPDGASLATACNDKLVRLWPLRFA